MNRMPKCIQKKKKKKTGVVSLHLHFVLLLNLLLEEISLKHCFAFNCFCRLHFNWGKEVTEVSTRRLACEGWNKSNVLALICAYIWIKKLQLYWRRFLFFLWSERSWNCNRWERWHPTAFKDGCVWWNANTLFWFFMSLCMCMWCHIIFNCFFMSVNTSPEYICRLYHHRGWATM